MNTMDKSLQKIQGECQEAVGQTPTPDQIWEAAREALIFRTSSFPSDSQVRNLIIIDPEAVLAFLI